MSGVSFGDTSSIGWPVCLKLFKCGDNVYFDTQVVLNFLGLEKHVKKNGFKFIDKFLIDNVLKRGTIYAKETHIPKEAIINGDLHYLVDECGDETMNEVIATNFIELFRNSLWGMAGACSGQCTIDNVEVECGDKTGTRKRREAVDGKQSLKIPLVVHFALKVPLPTNASLVDLNQTAELLSNDILVSLNETDMNLNISGIVIEYDASKPPALRLVRLVCDKGQVQRGTKCVNCPLGYFFNDSDCLACTVDQYQDQEAQNSCILCPSGTTTFGKTASKWRKNCQEIPSMSSTEKQSSSKTIIVYSGIAVGSLVFIIVLILVAVFCARKLRHNNNKTPHHGTRNNMMENIGHSNPAYVSADDIQGNDPFYMEICEFQKTGVETDNSTHYFALNDISQHDYEILAFPHSEA